MLDKTYRPDQVEERIYARWERARAFEADPNDPRPPFAVMMPPPNVTGSLHMGHALNMTLQDVLTRYWRMRGRNALWQPGTDHAGIATQMVVERQLADEGLDRRALGRQKFVERVWQWKAQSGGAISNQLRRLGASADWRRERFTLDEGLSRAVRTVFVRLYRDRLIYRDKRLVNWDPELHTAISDLEVDQRETQGKLWYFRYPLEGTDEFVTVATTRPETMLGDTAVAVHPEDPRYRHLIGRHVVLPLVGRRMPIIADDYTDPEKGTGAVKITPAHDFNDFEVGRRHGLEAINVLDARGRLNDAAPEAYRGLDRFEARKRVVRDIEALGLLEKVEDHVHAVPYGDRSGTPIEPWLTDQWYVDAATLAKPAIAAVEEGRIRFVPGNWANTYFEWMRNIQPWCISRQLWWGHQIPAWYGPDGEVFVAMDEAEAQTLAAEHYGEATELVRDEDVLDTWFSSGLWPFSTLGWPEPTPELEAFYPGDVLVTGFDIIFFWVARMIMLGLYCMNGEVPFRDVYIHALVRDERGQKMSKSKGNIIDPLVLMDRYGTDALRFTLAAMAAQGRDIKLSEQRVSGYRNFVTKLWNAARFCQMNECRPDPGFDPGGSMSTTNRWIVGALSRAVRQAGEAIEAYRFNDAAGALYHFLWHTFCDWYLELSKPVLYGDDEAAKAETRAVAAWTLDHALAALHPFMPFVTEELFAELADRGEAMLIASDWPEFDEGLIDESAQAEMDWVVRLVSEIRSVRAEMNVPPAAEVPAALADASAQSRARFERHRAVIEALARVKTRVVDGDAAAQVRQGAVQLVFEEASLFLKVADLVDISTERARLARERDRLASEIAKLDAKLSNAQFLARAPEEVVAEQRERRDEADLSRRKLDAAVARLSAL